MGYNSKLKAMQAIGYRHIVAHLQDRWDLDETRQLTWLRAERDIIWSNPDDKTDIINKVITFIAPKN